MRVSRITSADIAASGLVPLYAAECANALIGKPEPDWQMYAAMERTGAYAAFGLYADTMLGFCGMLMARLPHYSRMVATVESLYLVPAIRSGISFGMLHMAAERYAQERGCVAILYTAPADSAMEATLGKRYARTNSVFSKALAGRA